MILNIILAAATGAALSALVAVLLSRRKPKKKKKKKKEHNPLEFSKRIFIGLSVLTGAVAVFVCVMDWRNDSASVTQSLVDSAFDLLKVGVVSYFGKAALENRVKLSQVFPKLKEQIFNDRGGEP